MMSTSPVIPKCSAVPRPVCPSTPVACESSIATTASYFRANAAMSGRFELAVDRERPADEPHRSSARAVLIQRALAGLHDRGGAAQSQVVIRREDDHLAASLHAHARGLGGGEVVEALVDAVPPELVELAGESCGETHAISRMILPASPERMAASASSILASGNRWGMTGRGASRPAVR